MNNSYLIFCHFLFLIKEGNQRKSRKNDIAHGRFIFLAVFANLRFQHIFSYALIAHFIYYYFYGIRELPSLVLAFALMILWQLSLDIYSTGLCPHKLELPDNVFVYLALLESSKLQDRIEIK